MVGGQARITKDVPPYMMIDGHSGFVVGLNTIGLRRNGFTSEQILDIKNAYRLVYRSGMTWNEIVSRMAADTASAAAATYSEFFARSKRGITPERRPPPGATLRLAESDDAADEAAAARAKSRAG
jgi:UDP-N-acetylglucosamine acyltransferase